MKTLTSLLIFAIAMLLSNSLFAAGDIDTLIQHATPRGGGGVYALKMGYLSMWLFGGFWACFVVFNCIKWDFVSKCLSETKDGSCSPSGFRLFSYLLVISLCYCETYTTMRKQVFDTTQLLYMLAGVGVLTGFVKVTEITSIWKGSPATKDTPTQ